MNKLRLVFGAAVLAIVCIEPSPLDRSAPQLRLPSSEVPDAAGPRQEAAIGNHVVFSGFEENRGQYANAARYVARRRNGAAFVEPHAITLQLREDPSPIQPAGCLARDDRTPPPVNGVNVRLSFDGASPWSRIGGSKPLPGAMNYFRGNEPSQWFTSVPVFSEIAIQDLYPGIDLRLHTGGKHDIEYDLLVDAETPLEAVVISCEGCEIEFAEDELHLVTSVGVIRQTIPATWEILGSGERRPIQARFRRITAKSFGFEAPGRDLGQPLVIDPGLVFSTYLGGSGSDRIQALALDAAGSATVAGTTSSSTDFPITPGPFTAFGGAWDAFVARLSPAGDALVYGAFIGGSGHDEARAIALEPNGAATVAGITRSSNFPTTPGAFDTSYNPAGSIPDDGFVLRLSSPPGNGLAYSTFIGGNSRDRAVALALDASGIVSVTGSTESSDFPVTPGAMNGAFNSTGYTDGFAARLSLSGGGSSDLIYSTFFGGSHNDFPTSVAHDASGAMIIAGWTTSTNFPTTPGAYDTTNFGGPDAFVIGIAPAGNGPADLTYGTFLGGSGDESAEAIAVSASGFTLVGWTNSASFPTTASAFDSSHNGNTDAFVARVNPAAFGTSQLAYATFLGGSAGPSSFNGADRAYSLALDANGRITIAGITCSANFPTTAGAFDSTYNTPINWCPGDVFVSRLDLSLPGSLQLVYSTFVGRASAFWVGVALGGAGSATIAGSTSDHPTAQIFPTTPGAFDTTLSAEDGFVARLDMTSAGIATFGTPTNGCSGAPGIGANSLPQSGNTGFALLGSSAPPNTAGLLGISSSPPASPIFVAGIQVLIDLLSPAFALVDVTSDAQGFVLVPFPISAAVPPGLSGVAQFAWPDACAPGGVSASGGLSVTVQP